MEPVRGKSFTLRDIATDTYDFWTTFWSDNAQDEQSENTQVQTLKTYAATAQVNWQDPSTDEAIKVARLQSGSAGVDGWKGEELKHLPPGTLHVFRNLALSWGHRGQVSLQFLEARCDQIPKASKVDQVRPITVMSAWWRLWSPFLVKCASTRSWIEQAIPNEVIAVRGPRPKRTWPLPPYIRLLVKIIMDALVTSENVMSYDTLSPQGTEALLVAGNFLLIGSQLSDSFGIHSIERFFGASIVVPLPLMLHLVCHKVTRGVFTSG